MKRYTKKRRTPSGQTQVWDSRNNNWVLVSVAEGPIDISSITEVPYSSGSGLSHDSTSSSGYDSGSSFSDGGSSSF